jgi:outer membrane lipoprotein carrier protein
VLGACALLICGSVAAAELDEVLSRFDEVQNSIHTLSARFEMTTTSELLMDPISAEGLFFMTKPDSLRWEYTVPEEMRFVIFGDEYTGYYPEQKRAEKKNIQRWREHIFRFFGFGQGTDELQKFYDISLDADHDPATGSYLLILEPTRKRVRKRLTEEVRFWVDSQTYLPQRVEYRNKNGNKTVLDLQSIQVNPDLAASLYQVEIPADFEVTRGFGGLPDFESVGTTQ